MSPWRTYCVFYMRACTSTFELVFSGFWLRFVLRGSLSSSCSLEIRIKLSLAGAPLCELYDLLVNHTSLLGIRD